MQLLYFENTKRRTFDHEKIQPTSSCPWSCPAFTLGSAFSAQAADIGWVSEDGVWRYKDSSGNYVTNAWKASGDSLFYLGSDGKMAVSQRIDDESYVNENGAW